MNTFKINGRTIGEGYPAYIIAEMSANHAGSIERAKEIIRAAKEAGADCVKIQTYTPDTITMNCNNQYFQIKQGAWNGETLYQLYGKAYTPWEWTGELKAEAERVGIDFFSTPFDDTAVDFLESMGMEFYKIASFELVDLPLIKYVAQKGKPIILSTGMSTIEEVDAAINILRNSGSGEITLLHCTTQYPAPMEEVNLKAIHTLQKEFNLNVGFSDHTKGIEASVAAVALGACIIEKHLTLDKNMEGPDHAASIEPSEFKSMVDSIRNIEKALGSGIKEPTKSEIANMTVARKSIVAQRAIKKDEIFTEENISVKRPGSGISPMKWNEVIGKKAVKNFNKDELIIL